MPVPPRSHEATSLRTGLLPRRQPVRGPRAAAEQDDWPVDRGRPLGLRLLALVGALAFVMLGLSVITPLLTPQLKTPPRLPQSKGATA